MPKSLVLAALLPLGCMPSGPPRPHPGPGRILVAPPTRASAAVSAQSVPATYDDRCVRSYTDERGFERYDFSCAWREQATKEPRLEPRDDKCVRSHTDEKGFTRYDFSCGWREAIVLETAARKEACAARGGEWGKHGWFEHEGCAWHAKDAGKPCRDRTQCESRVCLAPASAARDTPTSGGCFECVGDCAISGQVVENGVARARIHTD